MPIGENIALVGVLLLALYGCAQLIRRVCLWAVRCPKCVTCWRVAVPKTAVELAPLFRCLQAQAVWEEPGGCNRAMVLLPPMNEAQQAALIPLLRESPAVLPVTMEELTAVLTAEDCI